MTGEVAVRRKPKATKARKVIAREPAFQGWATSDSDEIDRRRWRGRTEIAGIDRVGDDGPFGTFDVRSAGGVPYRVEIRSLSTGHNSCGCHDFSVNGLGTCKHIEGVLHDLRRRGKRAFAAAAKAGCPRAEVFADHGGDIRVIWPPAGSGTGLRERIEPLVEALRGGDEKALAGLRDLAAGHPDALRVSAHMESWLEARQRAARRVQDRDRFLADPATPDLLAGLVKHPLLPYQVDGLLHLAFAERALLADEMGLGKTVQAIAACALLRRLRGIRRVLVVSPASLKAEWQEQIARFTDLPAQIVSGPRAERLARYREPAFFNLANYEQILSDGAEINGMLAPDVVILDEAQRIKNWQTKTAHAVKALNSPHAFVLTGTPLENRIDEIYSIVQFLDPKLLGPLFRFNRDYYVLDERGKPVDYKNLDELGQRLRPVMLRRRKHDVESQLPGRTVTNYFVTMTDEQRLRYQDYQKPAQRILNIARRRPLTKQEYERLQRLLACMRMVCDSPYILDPENRDCPKLEELERILSDLLAEAPERKIIIFSEWVRMLELVAELAREMDIEIARHTGSIPQDQRRAEITRFKQDPACRLFLSSDAGSVGLNLQVADAVINMDLPWNPAKLEQRIGRAWRKYQTRPVSVVNLIAEDSIEHRMIYLLEQKQGLADGVLDGIGDVKGLRMPTGRAAFIERMEAVFTETGPQAEAVEAEAEAPGLALRDDLLERHGDGLLSLSTTGEGRASVLIAVLDLPPASLEEERRRVEASATQQVEFLDRQAYAAVRRLEAAGVIRFAGEAAMELYRSPRLEPARPAHLDIAHGLADQSDRKRGMAALLAGGGYELEAVPSAIDALEIALRALAVAHGGADPGDGADLRDVAEGLTGADILPRQLQRDIEDALSGGPDPRPALALVDGLLSRVRSIVESAGAASDPSTAHPAPGHGTSVAPVSHAAD
jgi:superfamily II DNA or RNA helicase